MKKISFSEGWRFEGYAYKYPNFQKPQVIVESLDLPHDFSVKLPRTEEAYGGAANGFYDGGYGRYSKYLDFGDWEHAILDVDGAYMCSRVYLNEHMLSLHPHGYTPYLVDLSEKMRRSGRNKVVITTQNLQPSTRWYSGAGLYRDVFLWVGGSIRIEPRDIFVTTKSADEKKAVVSVAVTVTADYAKDVDIELSVGSEKITCPLTLVQGRNEKELLLEVENPRLWDAENPNLYTLTARITAGGKEEDTAVVTFGIRTVAVSTKEGLLVNGKAVKLRGGCIHHDHGGLGAAAFPAAEERKISLLKKAGFNAVRTAHYPPSLALLEACDRLGMYVMDEAFDMWYDPKNQLDYSLWFADWWDRDIKSMVLRDRNHPCVISYSIGNEIFEISRGNDDNGWTRKLVAEVKKYDSTKPVTAALVNLEPQIDAEDEAYKETILEGYGGAEGRRWEERTKKYMELLDIVGYNYFYEHYEPDGKLFPDRIIWGSETHTLNIWKSWREVMRLPYVIGDFTWTAYDNLGEVGTGRSLWESDGVIDGLSMADYPWRTCFQGDLDLAGFRRPQSYFRESVWREDCEPKIFTTHPKRNGEGYTGTGWHFYDVCDTWTFGDDYIGKPVKADVYTDAEEIRFLLNGRDMGTAAPVEGIAAMDIPYEKGELTAVSYKGGKEIKRSSLHTVGEACQILAAAEKDTLKADNRDLCYINILAADQNGDRIPHSGHEISCEAEGGELMAVFSGNPANEDDYHSGKCHLFCGRAVAVVRASASGEVKLTVRSEGLKTAAVTVKAE